MGPVGCRESLEVHGDVLPQQISVSLEMPRPEINITGVIGGKEGHKCRRLRAHAIETKGDSRHISFHPRALFSAFLSSSGAGLVRRDLDIAMSDFLKEENVGKEKAAIFQLTFKQ
eukprot:scaffold103997_cov19-Tisochrysis_lutea.AAC.2